MIKPRAPKGTPPDTRQAARAAVPVRRIADGAVQMKTGLWVGVLGIHGLTWDLQSEAERTALQHRYAAWLRQQTDPWQVIVEATVPDLRQIATAYRARAQAWQTLAHTAPEASPGAAVLSAMNQAFAEWFEQWPGYPGEIVQHWIAITAPTYAESLRRLHAWQASLTELAPTLRPWIPDAPTLIRLWAHWADRPDPMAPAKGE
jgi:hypothetical protein